MSDTADGTTEGPRWHLEDFDPERDLPEHVPAIDAPDDDPPDLEPEP